MKCQICDADLPEDAMYCIECGAAVTQANIGQTVQLKSSSDGPRCSQCGTANPAGAHFCVRCGSRIAVTAASAAQPVELQTPAQNPPIIGPVDPQPLDTHESARWQRRAARRQRRGRFAAPFGGGLSRLAPLSGALFMIGLGVLFFTRWWWPGILALFGVIGFINEVGAGRFREGLTSLVFLGGLAVLFATGWFWPGILILLGLTALIGYRG